MHMKRLVNILLLLTIISIALTPFLINLTNAATVYTSSLEFNNTVDADSKVLSGITFYLINVTGSSTHGPYTCNSTGGYKFTTGIGNGTTYHIDFYWKGTKVYQTSNFATNDTQGSNNIVGPYTLSRLKTSISDSSVDVFIVNASGVSFSSVSITTSKVLTAKIEATGISIIKVFHGTDLTMPSKILVGGQDITAYKVTSEDLLGNYQACWYYDSTNRAIEIKGTHSSILTYEVQFAPSSWEPQIPSTITIFDTTIPTVLLITIVLLVIGAVAGGYLILASKR